MLSWISQKVHTFVRRIQNTVFYLAHSIVLPVRYRIKVKGAEFLNAHTSSTLFLANHSSHIDGTILTVALLRRHVSLTVWALDRTFKLPYLRWAARHKETVKVVKVPNINERRSEKHSANLHKLVTRTGDGLLKGHNFLIFPAGRCKTTPVEKIDGKSAIPLIIRQCPNVNIVLVRITGLWGSRFSCATKSSERWATRSVRSLDMLCQTLKMIFLNMIFFIPKRTVTVEFMPAPADFPRFGNRLEIGRYLENFFNAKWGSLGEPLYRVPDYFWKKHSAQHEYETRNYIFDLNQVPKPLRNAVITMIADKANLDCKDVDFDMHLGRDLGFDSLDIAEMLTHLENRYGIKRLVPEDLTTVGHLIAITAKIPITCEIQRGNFHEISEEIPLRQRLSQATTSFFRFGR